MHNLTDDTLVHLATTLADVLRATAGWHEPPRLYGLVPAGGAARTPGAIRAADRRWERLAEGDPYAFLDRVRVTEDDTDAVALAACGWAVPNRTRTRTVTVVTPDRRQCSVVERFGTDEIVVDCDGEGPLLRALASVWSDAAWRPPAA